MLPITSHCDIRMESLCIILPAYNEAKAIGTVLDHLLSYKKKNTDLKVNIVVVDDGSIDNTENICKRMGITVLTHILNRGLGGALATGLEYAKRNGFDYAVTMDSDGQHTIADIPKALQPLLEKKADVVIGSRMLGQKGMPLDRVLINKMSNVFTYALFGILTSDSQSGFRAFNRRALDYMIVRTQGMEVSSEIFAEIKKHKLRLIEVPISVIYTDYSRSKGQTNLNSLNIILKLLLRKFR